jgi:hypothetical protein
VFFDCGKYPWPVEVLAAGNKPNFQRGEINHLFLSIGFAVVMQ